MAPRPGLSAILALTLLAASARASDWKEPSAKEKANLELLLGRLTHARYGRAVLADAKHELRRVDEALSSLSKPVVLRVDCPSGARTLTVRTKLMAWRAHGEADGYYEWGGLEADGDDAGNAAYTNALALDPASVERGEGSVYGQAGNEALLYHELLHGQLLLDAAKSDAAWRASFCKSGQPDLGAADLDNPHKVIPALENRLREALWQKVQFEKKPWALEPGGDR